MYVIQSPKYSRPATDFGLVSEQILNRKEYLYKNKIFEIFVKNILIENKLELLIDIVQKLA